MCLISRGAKARVIAWRLRREPRRVSRRQYRLSPSRRGQPSHQPERRVRHQRFLRRLSRREHLFQQPLPILPNMSDPWKFNHMGIIIGTGEWDNTRHETLRLPGILNAKGIRALARRPEMVRARLELLARHAAVLLVEAYLHLLSLAFLSCRAKSRHLLLLSEHIIGRDQSSEDSVRLISSTFFARDHFFNCVSPSIASRT